MIFSLLHFRSVCFLSNYQLLLEQRLCHHLQTLLSCINPLHNAHCLYRERCVSYWQHRFIYICFYFPCKTKTRSEGLYYHILQFYVFLLNFPVSDKMQLCKSYHIAFAKDSILQVIPSTHKVQFIY